MSHRVGADPPDTGPGLTLVHVPLTPLSAPSCLAGAGEGPRGGLSAGAAVHAGHRGALGDVGLAEVALVTRLNILFVRRKTRRLSNFIEKY